MLVFTPVLDYLDYLALFLLYYIIKIKELAQFHPLEGDQFSILPVWFANKSRSLVFSAKRKSTCNILKKVSNFMDFIFIRFSYFFSPKIDVRYFYESHE